MSWCSDDGNGFTLEYPHISLHAISRDTSAFPHECIFMMLDTDFSGEAESNFSDDGESDVTTELRLVPDDRGMLDAMFHALNICQTLHPDPEDSFSDGNQAQNLILIFYKCSTLLLLPFLELFFWNYSNIFIW